MNRIMDKYSSFMKHIIRWTEISDDDRYGRQIIVKYAKEQLGMSLEGKVLDFF